MVLFLAILIIHIFAGSVLAINDISDLDKELDRQQVPDSRSSNLWLDFLKLVLVLALIIAAAWSIIRLFSRQITAKMQGTWLNVVDEVALGQNRGIVLCEIGGKIYALGVTDHSISLLFEVNNPDLLDDISREAAMVKTENQPNRDWWQKIGALISGRSVRPKTRPVQKDFHLMVEEQARRLQNISTLHTGETARERSGDNDQG